MYLSLFVLEVSLPLNSYEGLPDIVVSLPDVKCSSELLLDEAIEKTDLPSAGLPARNEPQDLVTVEECGIDLDQMVESLKKKLDGTDQNFLRGVLKFADRAKICKNQS